ncbi:MAG: aminotransferase class III-fold pyridoxal phosphate-dependent enzyme, partial [Nakamurella sp.]
MQACAQGLGAHLQRRLGELVGNGVVDVRGRGLWAGVELAPGGPAGRTVSEAMMARGVLIKETHESTLRFAPPLVITREEIDSAIDSLAAVIKAH